MFYSQLSLQGMQLFLIIKGGKVIKFWLFFPFAQISSRSAN